MLTALGLWVKPLRLRDGVWVDASKVFTFVLGLQVPGKLQHHSHSVGKGGLMDD